MHFFSLSQKLDVCYFKRIALKKMRKFCFFTHSFNRNSPWFLTHCERWCLSGRVLSLPLLCATSNAHFRFLSPAFKSITPIGRLHHPHPTPPTTTPFISTLRSLTFTTPPVLSNSFLNLLHLLNPPFLKNCHKRAAVSYEWDLGTEAH